MGRQSKGPSYESSKRRYVANINKEKIPLLSGVDETPENTKLAWEAYYRERAVRQVQTESDRSAIWAVLNEWLRWLEKRPKKPVSPATLRHATQIVQSFIDLHGNVISKDLRAWHIEGWLEHMQSPRPWQRTTKNGKVVTRMVRWNEGSVNGALGVMRAAFRWATARGLLTTNPFLGPDADTLTSGGVAYTQRRRPVEASEHLALLRLASEKSSKDFAILLMVLWGTGARPGEVIEAKAEEWDDGNRCFIIRCEDPGNIERFKLRRLKKDRVVSIPNSLVPFIRILVEKYKGNMLPDRAGQMSTPLFRTKKGTGYRATWFNGRLRSHAITLKNRAGKDVVRDGLTGYAWRHAFVTRWLVAGRDIKALADLLGTSVLMIEKHYSHLFRKQDVLRERLNQFSEDERTIFSQSRPASSSSSDGAAGQ